MRIRMFSHLVQTWKMQQRSPFTLYVFVVVKALFQRLIILEVLKIRQLFSYLVGRNSKLWNTNFPQLFLREKIFSCFHNDNTAILIGQGMPILK